LINQIDTSNLNALAKIGLKSFVETTTLKDVATRFSEFADSFDPNVNYNAA